MASTNLCTFPGCTSPAWTDAYGKTSQFCSRRHMQSASQQPAVQVPYAPMQSQNPTPQPQAQAQLLPQLQQTSPAQAQSLAPPAALVSTIRLCKNCHTKLAYVDRSKVPFVVHDFCGRNCANEYIVSGKTG